MIDMGTDQKDEIRHRVDLLSAIVDTVLFDEPDGLKLACFYADELSELLRKVKDQNQ